MYMTKEMLSAEVPRILAAPKTGGPASILCVRPDHNQRVFPERLRLTRAEGAVGDFAMSQPWLKLEDGRADPKVQISILPLRVLDLVWTDRANVPHPGDTIIADLDVSEENLPAGTLLGVGTAVLRVSEEWNAGCAKWRGRYGVPAWQWTTAQETKHLRLRGVFCSVETDGEVVIGDRIIRL